MYTKNYPKGAFHETAGNSIGISQASLAMLPNWKLRFESCQSQFAPISPKIDALKFDYSAFDDAPAVVPLGIWAFSSLTRAVARVALSDLNHSGSIPLYGRLRVSAEQIL
jgi:hypothetical protein